MRWLLGGILLGILALGILWWLTRPALQERREIFRGVWLEVETGPRGGRSLLVEVHWDTPGVRLAHRPFSFPVNPRHPVAPHFRLWPADWVLARSGAQVLINTTIYTPADWRSVRPGLPVRSVETVVERGQASHIHEHSYLLYWDAAGEARLLEEKPPSEAAVASAVLGIGLQGVQVSGGRPRYKALGSLETLEDRSFIGIDPEGKVLYLLAMEKATGREMIDRAVAAGVWHGGQLDTGKASHLLVGSGAKGLFPHTGLRGLRQVGGCLLVYAEPAE